MSNPDIAGLAAQLAHAFSDPAATVPAEAYSGISLEQSTEIQGLLMRQLGETAPASKIAIHPSGAAVAAPIYGSLLVADGGALPFPTRGLVGIEVELAVRLNRDITAQIAADRDELSASIAAFLVGIEVIGTRIDDRSKAGTFGPLADNSITAGYAYSTQSWISGPDVDGTGIEVWADGESIYRGAAKHPFGSALDVLSTYGSAQIDRFGALKSGMIVTTGTLCGLVEVPGPCMVKAQLGDQAVSVRLG